MIHRTRSVCEDGKVDVGGKSSFSDISMFQASMTNLEDFIEEIDSPLLSKEKEKAERKTEKEKEGRARDVLFL